MKKKLVPFWRTFSREEKVKYVFLAISAVLVGITSIYLLIKDLFFLDLFFFLTFLVLNSRLIKMRKEGLKRLAPEERAQAEVKQFMVFQEKLAKVTSRRFILYFLAIILVGLVVASVFRFVLIRYLWWRHPKEMRMIEQIRQEENPFDIPGAFKFELKEELDKSIYVKGRGLSHEQLLRVFREKNGRWEMLFVDPYKKASIKFCVENKIYETFRSSHLRCRQLWAPTLYWDKMYWEEEKTTCGSIEGEFYVKKKALSGRYMLQLDYYLDPQCSPETFKSQTAVFFISEQE